MGRSVWLSPVLLAAMLCVLAGETRGEIVERIVAKVNWDIITKTEWDDMVQIALRGQTSPLGEAEQQKLAEQILERQITDRLIIQAAFARGLKVNDSEVEPQVEAELDALKAKFPSVKEYNVQLQKEGITYQDLRYRYTQQMKDRFLYMKMINVKQRELEAQAEVSTEEIASYYEANKDKGEWMTQHEVRARHIQFNVDPELQGEAREAAIAEARKRLAAAQAALKRGERFEDVTKSLSEDISSRDRGGDLGTFAKGTYHESLERVAFSLESGQVSKPVESPVGLHLIKVDQTFKPRLKKLEENITPPSPIPAPGASPTLEIVEMPLADYLRAVLRNEKLSRDFQAWVDSLKSRAYIQRFLEEPAPL